MERRLRISFIEFLNALPLGWGLLHGSSKGKHDVLFDVPSECARHLRAGDADIGLIPVIEYQRIPGLRIVDGISIAAKREVRSVLFVSRKPVRQVRTVAVDTSSRTSVALLHILLTEFHKLPEVRFVEAPPHPEAMLSQFEAALVIGNAALQVSPEGLYVHDLAREWHRFTGLPFVFAFWAARDGIQPEGVQEVLAASKAEGLKSIPYIADWYSSRLPITASEIRRYLTSNLDYSLDEENRKGLALFFELSHRLGLTPGMEPLRMLDASGTGKP